MIKGEWGSEHKLEVHFMRMGDDFQAKHAGPGIIEE